MLKGTVCNALVEVDLRVVWWWWWWWWGGLYWYLFGNIWSTNHAS